MTTEVHERSAETRRSYTAQQLAGNVMRQCHEVTALKERFFAAEAERISECSLAMARAFDHGGKLFVMGNGGSSCDAAHMAVEFMHPIIEKRPPLPAIALTTDTAVLTAIGNDQDFSFAFVQQLKTLGRSGDMAMAMSTSGKSPNLVRAMQAAREMGMITIGFSGKDGGRLPAVCDYCFTVPSFSIPRIQETQETLLHIIWDLVCVIRGAEDVL